MVEDVTVFNIRKYLSHEEKLEFGEETLKEVLSEFFCGINEDVERFLKQQAIEFTKKNQSVTYLVFSNEDTRLVGYFTLAIKPISVNGKGFSNNLRRKFARVSEYDEESGTYNMAAYLIAQLGKNYNNGANNNISGEQLLQAAMEIIQEIQYRAGGMIVFVEAEENERLLYFYENQNGFKRFDKKRTFRKQADEHTLVQLLKVI